MRVLVFGSTGQVARALARTEWPKGTILIVARPPSGRPFAAREARRDRAQTRSDVVIIAAAYTHVDEAESEEALATTVNAAAPGRSRARRRRFPCPSCIISTDYVFDGEKERIL